jgi:hypothetical protein
MGVTTNGIFSVARKGLTAVSHRPVKRDSHGSDACRRCGGFLVDEHCMDLDVGPNRVGYRFWAMRCVQCGDVIDETILRNRLAPRPAHQEFPSSQEEGKHVTIYNSSSAIRRQTALRPPPLSIR